MRYPVLGLRLLSRRGLPSRLRPSCSRSLLLERYRVFLWRRSLFLSLSRLRLLCLFLSLPPSRRSLLSLVRSTVSLFRPRLISPPFCSSALSSNISAPSVLPTKSPNPVPFPISSMSSSPSSVSLITLFNSPTSTLFAPVPFPRGATGKPNALASASSSASLILLISSFRSRARFSSAVS
ncbi:hypothetical protein ACMFMG_012239 [Clarireedia jacksonii]